MALQSSTFVGCQVQQNAEEVEDMLYIYLEDRAVFYLNAAGAFSYGIICAVLINFICLYSCKLFLRVKLVQFRYRDYTVIFGKQVF